MNKDEIVERLAKAQTALESLERAMGLVADATNTYSYMREDTVWGRSQAEQGKNNSVLAFWDYWNDLATSKNPNNNMISDAVRSHELMKNRDKALIPLFEACKALRDVGAESFFRELTNSLSGFTHNTANFGENSENMGGIKGTHGCVTIVNKVCPDCGVVCLRNIDYALHRRNKHPKTGAMVKDSRIIKSEEKINGQDVKESIEEPQEQTEETPDEGDEATEGKGVKET